MEEIYYSPNGYWHGESAVTKLSSKAKVSKKEAREWLSKQPILQPSIPLADAANGMYEAL